MCGKLEMSVKVYGFHKVPIEKAHSERLRAVKTHLTKLFLLDTTQWAHIILKCGEFWCDSPARMSFENVNKQNLGYVTHSDAPHFNIFCAHSVVTSKKSLFRCVLTAHSLSEFILIPRAVHEKLEQNKFCSKSHL